MERIPSQGENPELLTMEEWIAMSTLMRRLPMPGEAFADSEAEQYCRAVVANAFGYSPQENPDHQELITRKLNRLTVLKALPEHVDPELLSVAQDLAVDVVRLSRIHIEQAVKERALTDISTHDLLTGAWNRNGGENILEDWVNRGPKDRATFSFDILFFKWFNDLLSYKRVGDPALQEAAGMIKGFVREADASMLVRVGGDEFRLPIGDISPEGFNQLEQRFRSVQDAKVTPVEGESMFSQRWRRILQMRREAEARGERFAPSVEVEPAPTGETPATRRMLYINGQLAFPLRDIIVFSVGGAYGTVRSMEDYGRLRDKSSERQEEHKRNLHALIDTSGLEQNYPR